MNLKPIIDSIFKSYRLLPIEKIIVPCRLPSNSEIKDIVMLSKELLFPGYFSKRTVDVHGDYRYTAKIIKKLHKKLKDQISTALLYLADSSKDKDIKKKSCSLCVEYIKLIPSIRETLHTDLEAHYLSDPAAFNKDQIVVSYPGFYAITVHRLAHALHLLGVPVLPRMMSEFAHRETGIDINPAAEIGEYFIDHGTGVVIGETTTIGRNVKIYQGVTLGALSLRGGQNLKGTKRHPTIQDNVTIYSGASILGGNTVIGENSTIGSNVYITGSLPANSRVSIKVPELVIKTYTKKEDEKHVV